MIETKEVIQERLLSNIDDSYDKSEGSFFYDVTKPLAIELEQAYKTRDKILDKSFVDTATGEDLDRKVAEQGITRKQATKSTRYVTITGINGSKIVKGEMVASDTVNFRFLEDLKIENNSIDVLVECEKFGSIGNVPTGAIKYFPKTLQGLQTVTNKEPFVNGYEQETDESLRDRYYTKVRTPATSGNKYHYLNWAKEVVGVGDARVIPLWNGNGTVKVVIIDANKIGASTELIQKVKNYIDPNDGDGEGQAPIGATCTIVSATELKINIDVTLTIESGFTEEQVKKSIEDNIREYLKEIAFKKDYVSYAKVGVTILETDGVEDYSNLKLNGAIDNVQVGFTEVSVLGGVVIG